MNELYVVARAVLLDALSALGPHRDALVLVGAQAIYLQVGDDDLAVRPYTTDGDLVLDPTRLGEIPPLEQALADAGFTPQRADSVGIWVSHRPTALNPRTEVCVDLLVPAGVSPGKGRRAARLTGHDARAARKVIGLEGVRLLRGVKTGELADRMEPVLGDARSADVARRALAVLRRTFGQRRSEGIAMAIRAGGDLVDADELAVSSEILARDLLEALSR